MKYKYAMAYASSVLFIIIILAAVGAVIGESFFGPSAYNSYTRQALLWRSGEVALSEDISHLELAVYNGKWYISFPPFPSVPMLLLTFFFGMNTPDNLLVKLYAIGAFSVVFYMMKKRGSGAAAAAFWGIFTTFACSLLPLLTNGGVWYIAQTLALFLTVSAIACAAEGKPTAALALYAFAVGCRPFNAVYAPLLLLLLWKADARRNVRNLEVKQRVKSMTKWLAPGIMIMCAVAAAYMAYNYIRFGNVLEFGHNHLPEYTQGTEPQFSLEFFFRNIKTVWLGSPFYIGQSGGLEINKFGFSMFIANPVFILLIIWFVKDLMQRRHNAVTVAAFLLFCLQLFLLMMHRTFGGFQFGSRYTLDLLPYAAVYIIASKRNTRFFWWEQILCDFGLLFMIMGTVSVHI